MSYSLGTHLYHYRRGRVTVESKKMFGHGFITSCPKQGRRPKKTGILLHCRRPDGRRGDGVHPLISIRVVVSCWETIPFALKLPHHLQTPPTSGFKTHTAFNRSLLIYIQSSLCRYTRARTHTQTYVQTSYRSTPCVLN